MPRIKPDDLETFLDRHWPGPKPSADTCASLLHDAIVEDVGADATRDKAELAARVHLDDYPMIVPHVLTRCDRCDVVLQYRTLRARKQALLDQSAAHRAEVAAKREADERAEQDAADRAAKDRADAERETARCLAALKPFNGPWTADLADVWRKVAKALDTPSPPVLVYGVMVSQGRPMQRIDVARVLGQSCATKMQAPFDQLLEWGAIRKVGERKKYVEHVPAMTPAEFVAHLDQIRLAPLRRPLPDDTPPHVVVIAGLLTQG